MKNHLRALVLLFSFFVTFGKAQNLLITAQNPDALAVCEQDTLTVNLINTQAVPVTGIKLTVTLHSGIEYEAGSVQNAVENNITVPNVPVFDVPDIPGNGTAIVKLKVHASCGLVEAINSGLLFTNNLKAEYNGGSDAVTTLAFTVETGLLVFVSVNPLTMAGEKGNVLQRQIHFKNTRLGRIGQIQFADQHTAGFSVTTPGAATQSNVAPDLFEAEFDGNFFSNIGDGDAWLEYNEEGIITEEIEITDCGAPPFDALSNLYLRWGCGALLCQYDSAEAVVQINTSSLNPDLEFIPIYHPPSSYCADAPTVQELLVVNHGQLKAVDVVVDLRTSPGTKIAFEAGSFDYNNGNGWTTLAPNLQTPLTLNPCGVQLSGRCLMTLPEAPANDTSILRFNTFSCAEACTAYPSPFYAFTFYTKACPVTASESDSVYFKPDTLLASIKGKPIHDLGTCLKDGECYPLEFAILTPALTSDTGYLQVFFDLPKGLHWDTNCVPQIEGQSPSLLQITPGTAGASKVLVAFKLPFNADSVAFTYCLCYNCVPGIACEYTDGTWGGDQGGNVTVYPFVFCPDSCGLRVETTAAISTMPDTEIGCGRSSCNNFILFVERSCEPFPDKPPVLADLLFNYTTYRINYGYRDNDNNRAADNLNPPDLNLIRRDRYIPGDTLRVDLRGVAITENVSGADFKLFFESMFSQMSMGGGDPYLLSSGQSWFTNYDSTAFVGGTLKITKANGEMSDCPAVWSSREHKYLVAVADYNVEPKPVIDQLITMNHEFFLNFLNCSPDGLGLYPGDSIRLLLDFTFRQNFLPIASAVPALTNFRSTIWGPGEHYAWVPPQGPMSQYSGYTGYTTYPQYTVKPCETAYEIAPFDFLIRLAKPNMFPFEVRPLARLFNFVYDIPPGVELQAAVTDVRLQENVPWVDNDSLDWALNGTANLIDYDPLFASPLDEGFKLRTNFTFGPSCTFIGPDTSIVTFNVQYPEAFPGPSIVLDSFLNTSGFFDALPLLAPYQLDSTIDMVSPNLILNFSIKNSRPAQAKNAFVYFEPLNGAWDNVKLLRMPQQQEITGVAGLYNLGTIGVNGIQGLRLLAHNTNCGPLRVRMVTGWDCEQVTSAQSATCGRDTVTLELRLLNAVLELNPVSQPLEVPLCAPSDWFVMEVSNGNDGNAFSLTPSIKLPQGLEVVPGSTEVSYPNGAPFTSTADPHLLGGNVFQWKMEEILPGLSLNGLPGFQMTLANAFQLRFKAKAGCGFVANSQPVYGIEGKQPCGISTNKLRKPDEAIGLVGIGQPYGVEISLSPMGNDSLYCGELLEIAAQVLLQGIPSPTDSIYLIFPQGVSYEPGSYVPGQNAPAGPPFQLGQSIQLPIPSGLGVGSVLKFGFKVRYEDAAGCTDQFITAQTRQQTSGFCVETGQDCNVYIATGEALLLLPAQNPDLVLSNFTATNISATGVTFNATVNNPGLVPAPQTVLQFYLDQNSNGAPDAGDQLLLTLTDDQVLPPGGMVSFSGLLNLSSEELCKVLAVLPADENCACSPKYYPVSNWTIDEAPLKFCAVNPFQLGVTPVSGHAYNWQPVSYLDCNTCAQTTFTPGAGVMPGDAFVYLLVETAGTCQINHIFNILFSDVPGIETPDQTICKGETVTLNADAGGSAYVWTGPGVQQGNAVQVLAPESSATYAVTITLADGCTGTDVVHVEVLQAVETDLGLVKTCPGVPLLLFDEMHDQPGIYCKTYPAANGCDSIACIRLELFGTQGASAISLCEGDSIMVFDTLRKAEGVFCKSFLSPNGCDSTHCVTLSYFPSVSVTQPDTIFLVAGDSVQLAGPSGYISYTWEPSTWLSCITCQSPFSQPDSNITYHLYVKNEMGCIGDVIYRLVVLPPCDPQKLLIPSAITPDGDGMNDVFRVVPYEGVERVLSLTIYDRWGEKVYEGTGPAAAWDATINGKPAPSDVYVYIIEADCSAGDRQKIIGDVTVIR